MTDNVCYKLLTAELQSINRDVDEPGAILQYCVNEWREPVIPYSKLFVFDTQENARQFRKLIGYITQRNLVIYRCEVKNPVVAKVVARQRCGMLYGFPGFWQKRNDPSVSDNQMYLSDCANEAPKGTLMVDAVKILDEVEVVRVEDRFPTTPR